MSRYVKDANGVWHPVAGLEAIDSTPTQGSTAAVSSGGVYASEQTIKQALTTVESSIAPIEDGTNYSTTYIKGTRFMRGGKLYKVTASSVNASTPIDTGVGGNATQMPSLANNILISNSETANISSKVTGGAHAIRIGNIIQLSFELTPITGETIASNNEVLISGLPAPAIIPYNTLITNDGQAISCTISLNGDLKTYYAANAWTAGRMDGTLIYLVERLYT